MNNLDDMTRQEKALVMVIGVAESLERLGVVTKSRCHLSDEDWQRYRELIALGFQSTPEEIAQALYEVQILCANMKDGNAF